MRRLLAWLTALSLVCSPQIALSQILLPILTGGFNAGGGAATTYVLLMGNENANNGSTYVDQCNTGTGCPHTLTNTGQSWAAATGTWPGCCTAPSFVSSAPGTNTNVKAAASSAWDVSAGGSFTVGIWAKCTTTTFCGIMEIGLFGTTDILSLQTNGSSALIWYLSSTSTTWDIVGGTASSFTADANWHYYEINYDGTTYRLSADGTVVASVTSASHLYFNATTSDFYCGQAAGADAMTGQWASCFAHTGSALHTGSFTPSSVPFAH